MIKNVKTLKSQTISASLEPDIYDKLIKLALKDDRTVANLVRRICTNYVRRTRLPTESKKETTC